MKDSLENWQKYWLIAMAIWMASVVPMAFMNFQLAGIYNGIHVWGPATLEGVFVAKGFAARIKRGWLAWWVSPLIAVIVIVLMVARVALALALRNSLGLNGRFFDGIGDAIILDTSFGVLIGIVLWYTNRNSRPKGRRKQCTACGYNLEGSLEQAHCPECGNRLLHGKDIPHDDGLEDEAAAALAEMCGAVEEPNDKE